MKELDEARTEISKIIVKVIKADRWGRQTQVEAVHQILDLKGDGWKIAIIADKCPRNCPYYKGGNLGSRREGMSDKVTELVERIAQILWDFKNNAKVSESAFIWVKQILPDLAFIDPICGATLDWHKSDVKVQQDMPCDNWDCSRGIKKGETYYIEEYIKEGQCHTWCIECAAYFMAQKLSYVIPLAKALREKK